jgi:hypothetical protein
LPVNFNAAPWCGQKLYTPEEKVAILRRHLLEKEPISTSTVFYRWQKASGREPRCRSITHVV